MLNNEIAKRKQKDIQPSALDNLPATEDVNNAPKRQKIDLAAPDATQERLKPDETLNDVQASAQPHLPNPKPASPHRPNRRLDSLARLIEGMNICTAVCRIGNDILITSNMIYAPKKNNFPGHQHINYIQKILRYFKTEQSKESDIDILREIATTKINSLMKKNIEVKQSLQIDSNSLDKIVAHLYGLKTGMEWLKKDLAFYEDFLSEEDKQSWERRNDKKLTALNKLALMKIKNKITGIQFVFEQAWRLIRDFRKVKTYFQENNDVTFKVLAIGDEKEHAEVRMIGYLMETGALSNPQKTGGPQSTTFIGLSKLCCVECARLIHTVNQAIVKQNGPLTAPVPSVGIQHGDISGKQSLSSPDDMIAAIHALEEIERSEEDEDNDNLEEGLPIATTGEHGLSFKKSWATPLYVQKSAAKDQRYLGNAFNYWELTNASSPAGQVRKINYAHVAPVHDISDLRQACVDFFQLPIVKSPAIKGDKHFVSMTSVASGSPSSSPEDIDLGVGVSDQTLADIAKIVHVNVKPNPAVDNTPSPTPKLG